MYRYKIALIVCSLVIFLSFDAAAQKTDEFNLDQVYAVDSDGTINLQSDDANVTITGSDREDVRVVVNYRMRVKGLSIGEREGFEMIVEEANGNLNIYEKEGDNGNRLVFGSSNEEYEITIEAPRGVSLNLEGDDETYRIRSIDGSIKISADDSDVELNECKGDNFYVKLDDGELIMDEGKGTLELDIDDGDARIMNGDFREMQINGDDGEFDITTRLADGGNYRFELDDGDLRLNIAGGGGEFDIRHDNANISTDREFEQTMDDENRAAFRLPLGSATVSIRSDDGDIELRVI